MDILDKIAAAKREEVRFRKEVMSEGSLKESPFFMRTMPSFRKALSGTSPSVIGEFKRRSPSKGEININADIRRTASGYQDAGIAAMSVLTDEQFFGGNNSDLESVAEFLEIPVLRKDFIVDEYQVTEAKSIGASAILLIASMLTKNEVREFSQLAVSLGMAILFEIHDFHDLDKLNDQISIIGVNNRNLRTFSVSTENSAGLLKYLPDNCIKIAESGFRTPEDVRNLHALGYDAFLIGETFMRSVDPGQEAGLFMKQLKLITG
jgi:indole-3-glycerol phosphate synthase